MYTNIVAAPVTQSKLFICIGVHLCLIGQSSSLVNSSEAHMYICSVTVLQRQRSYDALCCISASWVLPKRLPQRMNLCILTQRSSGNIPSSRSSRCILGIELTVRRRGRHKAEKWEEPIMEQTALWIQHEEKTQGQETKHVGNKAVYIWLSTCRVIAVCQSWTLLSLSHI